MWEEVAWTRGDSEIDVEKLMEECVKKSEKIWKNNAEKRLWYVII